MYRDKVKTTKDEKNNHFKNGRCTSVLVHSHFPLADRILTIHRLKLLKCFQLHWKDQNTFTVWRWSRAGSHPWSACGLCQSESRHLSEIQRLGKTSADNTNNKVDCWKFGLNDDSAKHILRKSFPPYLIKFIELPCSVGMIMNIALFNTIFNTSKHESHRRGWRVSDGDHAEAPRKFSWGTCLCICWLYCMLPPCTITTTEKVILPYFLFPSIKNIFNSIFDSWIIYSVWVPAFRY